MSRWEFFWWLSVAYLGGMALVRLMLSYRGELLRQAREKIRRRRQPKAAEPAASDHREAA